MKSLLIKLGVILTGLGIFGYAEVWGANWKYIGKLMMESISTMQNLRPDYLITRRAEFHGLCPWVNEISPIGRQA